MPVWSMMEETVCEIIRGAPTTLAVKGEMMMIMMMMICQSLCVQTATLLFENVALSIFCVANVSIILVAFFLACENLGRMFPFIPRLRIFF